MTVTVDIILLVLFNFLIRMIYFSTKSTDEYGALWIIKQSAKSGFNYQVENSIPNGYFGYPRFPHWVVSHFPEKYWNIAGRVLNILYDCIAIVIIYFVILSCLKYGWVQVPKPYGNLPFYIALLYGTTPILFPVTARLKSFAGRTIGGLFSLVYFLGLGAAFVGGYPVFYMLAIAGGVMTIVSSQFGMQNITFVSIFLSLFYWSWVPSTVLLVSFLTAILIRPFRVEKILKFKFSHYVWYLRNSAGTTAEGRNKIKDYIRLPLYLFKKPGVFLDLITRKLTFIILLYSVPMFFALVTLVLLDPETVQDIWKTPVCRYITGIIGGGIFAFILTSLKPFLFLGQAERYFEYSAPFICVLFVLYGVRQGWYVQVSMYVVVIHICIIMATFLFLTSGKFKQNVQMVDRSRDSLFSYLNQTTEELRILTIKVKNSWDIACQVTNPKVIFYYLFIRSDGKGFEYMEQDFVKYNVPKPDFEIFKRKYKINTLIVETSIAETGKLGNITYDFDGLKNVAENDEYRMFRIDTDRIPN